MKFANPIFDRLKPYPLTTYELFAIVVIAMIVDHIFYYSMYDALWVRLLTHLTTPVIFVAAGYNVGRGIGRVLVAGCLAVVAVDIATWGVLDLPVNALFTVILARLVMEPLLQIGLKNKWSFWLLQIALVSLAILSGAYIAYGTVGIIMMIAGRILRSEHEIPPSIVTAKQYFVFTYLSYVGLIIWTFGFSGLQSVVFAAGVALIMTLLYHFRDLLMNAVRRRPTDIISKLCAFTGHKMLEIYIIHIIIFKLIVFYALNRSV